MVYIAYGNDLSEARGLASSILSRLESVGSRAGVVEIVVLLEFVRTAERKMPDIKDQLRNALKSTHHYFPCEPGFVDLYEFVSNVRRYVLDAEIRSLCDEVLADLTSPEGPIIAN